MKNIIVTTQCISCGSWECIKKILLKLQERGYSIKVISLGDKPEVDDGMNYLVIPYPKYNRYGNITCYHPILSFLWNLPLFVAGILTAIIERPNIFVFNGLTSGFSMAPFIKLFGIKTIVMDHSYIGELSGLMFKALKLMGKYVDIVIVNSLGCYEDIMRIVNSKKIIVNEHHADNIFFEGDLPNKNSALPFNITYIGRIDEDKMCFPLMDFAEKLGGDKTIEFNFAGAGSEISRIENLSSKYDNVHYHGLVKNREALKQCYKVADVVWAFADTTYLALPAIESLASGTPIIVPKYAAIYPNDKLIDTGLVPKNIGWIIDPFDLSEIQALIDKLLNNRDNIIKMSKECREYALERYSNKNLTETIDKIMEHLIH